MAESVRFDKKSRHMAGKFGSFSLGGASQLIEADNDWSDFDPTAFSYSTSTTFNVSGFDPTERFQLGDRIRWAQVTERFAFVSGLTDTTITINAGTDYSIANGPIQSFRMSKFPNPSDFPRSFAYDMNTSGGMRVTNEQSVFFIIGSWCYIQFYTFSTLGALSASSYDFDLPEPANVWMNASGSFIPSLIYSSYSTGHGISTVYDLRFDIVGSNNGVITMSDPRGTTLLGLAEMGLSIVYPMYVG